MSNRFPAQYRHAVVLGGSMAGLLTARILTDFYQQVTIIERDAVGDTAEPRKGVPQGRHNHVLLGKGIELLGQLFPGILTELAADGAIAADLVRDLRWFHFGGYKVQTGAQVPAIIQSRPFLESAVRHRVLALPNLTYRAGYDVLELMPDAARQRIVGVLVRSRRDDTAETLAADLVVDAMGRGSPTPKWLEALGYRRPAETVVKIDVGYASRIYRRKAEDLPGAKLVVTYPTPPADKRMASLFPLEGDRWGVTLGGWLGDHPPTDEAGFLEFARKLAAPDIYNVISRAEPVSEIMVHKFPSSLRRHYEKLTRFPLGYLVVGDAVCSFNPIYGQGMASAALQAATLAEVLTEQNQGADPRRLAPRFFKKASKIIDTLWLLATGEDFRYPAVEGPRPLGTALVNWYTGKVHELTTYDPVVYAAFLEVMNLTAPPTVMFHPRIAWRVLRACWPGRRAGTRGVTGFGFEKPVETIVEELA